MPNNLVIAALTLTDLALNLGIKAIPDARLEAEARIRKRIEKVLKVRWGWVTERIEAGEAVDLAEFEAELRGLMQLELRKIADEQARLGGESIGIAFDTTATSEAASDWALNYSYNLVRDLTDKTRRVVTDAMGIYHNTPGMTRGELQGMLEPAFGAVRADRISITETTRAFGQAAKIEKEMLRDMGILSERIWRTNRDGITCVKICRPLDNVVENERGTFTHPQTGVEYDFPAHVGCRCGPSLRYKRK